MRMRLLGDARNSDRTIGQICKMIRPTESSIDGPPRGDRRSRRAVPFMGQMANKQKSDFEAISQSRRQANGLS
jgi:hypothetical protein